MAKELTAAALGEVGCITYEFYRGTSDTDTLVLFQEWETMDALMEHLTTPHVEAFLRSLPEISSGDFYPALPSARGGRSGSRGSGRTPPRYSLIQNHLIKPSRPEAA